MESKKYNKQVNITKKERSRLTDIENKLVVGGEGQYKISQRGKYTLLGVKIGSRIYPTTWGR